MKPESLLARCRLARFPTSRSGKQPWPRSWVAAFRASDREDREEGKSSVEGWRWVGEGRAGVWGCCCGTATADAHNYPPLLLSPLHTNTARPRTTHNLLTRPNLSLFYLSFLPNPLPPCLALHPTLKGASSNGPPVRSSAPTPAPARSSAGAPPPSTPPRRRPPSAGAHLA